MTTATLTTSLLSTLDIALFERNSDGAFSLVGEVPEWLETLWPDAVSRRSGLHPEEAFLYLEYFLPEAERVWTTGEIDYLTSEVWTEVDEEGKSWLLEATALRTEENPVLLIKFPSVAPETIREVLQQSRELNLEHYHLRKAIDRREVLLHCLVHDLGTPLASIKGSLRLLLEDKLVVEEGSSLANIGLRQVDKMQTMLHEMLTAFVEDRREVLVESESLTPDLATVVQDLTSSLLPMASIKRVGIRMETEAPSGTDWQVIADQVRLERVLFNLIENAVRHSPENADVIVRLVDEGNTVRTSIEDEGQGVPPHQVDRLFRRFSQGEGSAGKAGLGLYFCRITLEGWGGAIGYLPGPRGGACFWFRLPKPHADNPAYAASYLHR